VPGDPKKELQNLLRRPVSRRYEPRGLLDPLPRPLKPRPANPFRDPFREGQCRPTPPGARAKRIPAESYPLEFGPIDVLDVRARFHATQEEFARMIGISVDTLRNWEQGKRRPQGPSRALLRVAAANPNVVAQTLLRFRRAWWMSW
jgi:putative transcriptional regulator